MRVPKLVRRITDPLLERTPVPIIGGTNRGLWWNLASAGSGYGSGRRAAKQMDVLASLIRPGDIVWDVGAHHGYVTLCAARRVGSAGRVHAFEPSERNRMLLSRHVRWNGLSNVTIHPFALSSYDGEAYFGGTGTSKMHSLGGGAERAIVRSAGTLVRSGVCPAPTFVKIDVEGAEAEVIEGALEVLPKDARLLIALHSRAAYAGCATLLNAAGYELVESKQIDAYRTRQWVGDPDLFCFGPDYIGSEHDRKVLRETGF